MATKINTKGCLKPIIEYVNSEPSYEEKIITGKSSQTLSIINVVKLQNNDRAEDFGNFIELVLKEKQEKGQETVIPKFNLNKELEFVLLLSMNSFFKKTNKDNFYSSPFFWQAPKDIKFYENGKQKETFKTLDEAKTYANKWGYKVKTHLYILHNGEIKCLSVKGTGSASWIDFCKSTGIEQRKFTSTVIVRVGQMEDNYYLTDFALGSNIDQSYFQALEVSARTLYYFLSHNYSKVKETIDNATHKKEEEPKQENKPVTPAKQESKPKTEVKKPASKPTEETDFSKLKPYQIKESIRSLMPDDQLKANFNLDLKTIFDQKELIDLYWFVHSHAKGEVA